MKVRDRVCDICGESVYERGYNTYQILEHRWWLDYFPKKVDLCQNCYNGLERYIISYNLYGDKESSDADSN